jgi:type IV secretory pathway TrbF-like protein
LSSATTNYSDTEKARVSSPYTDAKRSYIERTANDILVAVSMRRLSMILGTALCFSLLANVVLATTAKFVPVYVHDNAQGQVTYVGPVDTNNSPSDTAVRSALADWISNAREISSDPMATRERQRRVAALVMNGSEAQSFLKSFYQQNDPMTLGFTRRVAVAVNFVSPIGASTREYEAEWTEQTRDADGRESGSPRRFHGRFTITLARLADEAAIYINPLGLFITDLDWAEKVS